MKAQRYNIKINAVVETILCDCCYNESENMITESYSDFDGFMHIGNANLHICPSCYKNNTFINEYGFLFIKAKDKYSEDKVLYVTNEYGSLEIVRAQSQIDKAFNPNYHEFLKWKRK